MIIQKSPSLNDIVSFKLTTGEEIVGRFQSENNQKDLVIKSPLVLGMVSANQLAFGPYMTSIEDGVNVTFVRTGLANYPVLARKDVANTYQQVTTGITIPTTKESASLIFP